MDPPRESLGCGPGATGAHSPPGSRPLAGPAPRAKVPPIDRRDRARGAVRRRLAALPQSAGPGLPRSGRRPRAPPHARGSAPLPPRPHHPSGWLCPRSLPSIARAAAEGEVSPVGPGPLSGLGQLCSCWGCGRAWLGSAGPPWLCHSRGRPQALLPGGARAPGLRPSQTRTARCSAGLSQVDPTSKMRVGAPISML